MGLDTMSSTPEADRPPAALGRRAMEHLVDECEVVIHEVERGSGGVILI
jgi:hypothetical protein